MPKEITHWLVAQKAAAFAPGSLPGDAGLTDCPNALKLGAVFPDVLYYLTNSTGMARYREVAQACHGAHGEDTNALLRLMAAQLPGSPYPTAFRSFLAGLACHVQTDRTFHPLVTYLTGTDDEADPRRRTQSVQDHRRLECLLDLYFCGGTKGLKMHSLGKILRDLELPLAYIVETFCRASAALHACPATVPVTRQALNNFRQLQRLFQRRALARLLDKTAPWLPPAIAEVAALFYGPALDAHLPKLSGELAYRNPVSGIAEEVTLRELFDRSVAGSIDIINKIEDALRSGIPVLPEKGPSLSYGIVDEGAIYPRYFSARPFFT